MPLKKTFLKKENKEPEKESDDLYRKLKREIAAIRSQGDPPQKDPLTFSRYVCDLCSTSHPLQDLKQCSICGRWACPSCWTQDYYVCNSCGGIIRIHALSQK
jgi:hypothetical protein